MTLEGHNSRRLVLITLEKSTVIHRPSDEVFAFVADQTNAASWQSGIVEVRRLTDGPPGVGSRHTFTRTLMGRRMTGENEYVEFEPGEAGRVSHHVRTAA